MKTHQILVSLSLMFLFLSGVGSRSRAASAAETPPNVVLIISDDQRWTDFGFMGHEVIQTPNLDRLARQSAVFPFGYVPSSLCRPSLATIVTGLYPHQHKITGNDPPKGTRDRNVMLKHIRRLPTLPERLGEKGYLSHQSGKWWEGHYREGGFTHGMTHGDPSRGGRHGDLGLEIGRKGMEPIFEFIEEAGERPFFIWYAPFLPHTPHNPPGRLLDKYKQEGRSIHVARYYAMCEWFDETCGQLLDYLDEKKLSENTLVVFVTDNGWIQRKKGRGYAPRSKRSPYDGGIRTPIMLRLPGRVEPAKHETPVSSIDLAPTILTACGMTPDASLPGIDLLPVCRGEKPERQAIFGEIFLHDVVDIDRPAAGLLHRICIQDRWKLILSTAPNRGQELYNLGEDPHETKNLAKQHDDRVQRMTILTDAWWDGE